MSILEKWNIFFKTNFINTQYGTTAVGIIAFKLQSVLNEKFRSCFKVNEKSRISAENSPFSTLWNVFLVAKKVRLAMQEFWAENLEYFAGKQNTDLKMNLEYFKLELDVEFAYRWEYWSRAKLACLHV